MTRMVHDTDPIPPRYLAITRDLARRAVTLAEAAPRGGPHEGRPGERRVAAAVGLAAAWGVLGENAPDPRRDARDPRRDAVGLDAWGLGEGVLVTDGFGHTRPVYLPLLRHVLHLAGAASFDPADGWASLCPRQDARSPRRDAVGFAQPVYPQGAGEALDAWTYRELVALHAMDYVAHHPPNAAMQQRVRRAAVYHQQHTQPDYTTYQPWALAAFLRGAETRPFAEQQLHDVETHLAVEGPAGAVIPALLLTLAVHALTI